MANKNGQGGEAGRVGRTRILRVRVSEGELQRWRAAATRTGVKKLSRWVRASADQAAACGDDPLAWRRDLAVLLRDMNAGVGNNINQLVRRMAHSDPEGPCALALARMADDLAGLRHDVRAHLLGGVRSGRRASRQPTATSGAS
jgi:hypothetical protein